MKEKLEFAREKLLQDLKDINFLFLKFENYKLLCEFYLLLNRKYPKKSYSFPVYLTYIEGNIFITSDISNHKIKFKNYLNYKKELFSDDTTLFYDASSRDMLILSKNKKQEDIKNYIATCLAKNIDVNDIFKICSNLWYEEGIIFLLDNYKILNNYYCFCDIIIECKKKNNLILFRKIMSYNVFNNEENLDYALAVCYGEVSSVDFMEYLILELHAKFHVKVYRYAAIFSVQRLNFKSLKKISKKIDIKFDDQKLLSFGIFTKNTKMIQYLIDEGFNINNNCKNTLLDICIVNDIEILDFLIKKGLKIENSILNEFINKCYKEGKFQLAAYFENK